MCVPLSLFQPPRGTMGQTGRVDGAYIFVELHFRIMGGSLSPLVLISSREVHKGTWHLLCNNGEILRCAGGNARTGRQARKLLEIFHHLVCKCFVTNQRRHFGEHLDFSSSSVKPGQFLSPPPSSAEPAMTGSLHRWYGLFPARQRCLE